MHAIHQSTSRTSQRIVIVGAGIGGLLAATFLLGIDAEIVVLPQPMTPARKRFFPGLFPLDDLRAAGMKHLAEGVVGITAVTQVMRDAEAEQRDEVPVAWVPLEHGEVLDALEANLRESGVVVQDGFTATTLLQDAGQVVGVLDHATSRQVAADIVILGDEADPRLAEQVGLRPDWLPTQLMHLGKERFAATPAEITDRFGRPDGGLRMISLRYRSEWGAWGHALVIPQADSFTIVAAMLLEEEMRAARHIREFLDEVEATPVISALTDGLVADGFFTEVVPVGGFEERRRFHTDGFLVASDLVGVTNPLNRDGLSLNLRVAAAAAMTAGEVVRLRDGEAMNLAAHSRRISQEIITPIQFRQRQHRSFKDRPAWEWATFPELVPGWDEVTVSGISATLPPNQSPGLWGRVRRIRRQRVSGQTRH